MTGPTAGVDDDTAWLVLASPVAEANDAVRWLTVVDDAVESVGALDWAAFDAHVRERAELEGFDAAAVATFLDVAAANGEFTPVLRLRELGDQLPVVLAELRQAQAGTEDGDSEDGGPLGWVSETQQGQLAGLWGPEWTAYLVADLDQRWGEGWQSHPGDHKASWLDDLLASGTYSLAGNGDASPADDGFGWVPPQPRQAVEAAWGQAWQEPLSGRLAQLWGPGWEAHPAEHKAAWLTDLVAAGTLVATETTEPAPEQTASAAQAAVLDEFLAAARQLPGAENLSESELAELAADVIEKAGA